MWKNSHDIYIRYESLLIFIKSEKKEEKRAKMKIQGRKEKEGGGRKDKKK